MLKPENRLKKVRDFNLLLKYGRWIKGQFIDLNYLFLAKQRENFPKKVDLDEFAMQLKVAFAVGLKISKSAVKRNRLRRQIREVVRLLIKSKRILTGYYLLFVARTGSLNKNYAEISQEIEFLLHKAKILK
jgi:ribonuclease P protein component